MAERPDDTSRNELKHLVWQHYRIRVAPTATKEHLRALLDMRERGTDTSEINAMREELIDFITRNTDRLSLSCDGNCWNHHDGLVLQCHAKLLQDSEDHE